MDKNQTTEKFDFIINKRSGTVLHVGEDMVREELIRAFGEKTGKITFVEGQDVAETVKAWVTESAGSSRGIIIGGGDGTVLTAADQVMGHEGVTLGVLPMGTQNFFSRRLGFAADFKTAAEQYQNSEPCSMDVGVVNGMHFLIGLMLDQSSVKFFEAREHLRDKNRFAALKKAFLTAVSKQETLIVTRPGSPEIKQRGQIFAVTSNPLQPHSNQGNMRHVLNTQKLKDISGNMFAQGKEALGKLGFYVLSPSLRDGASLIKSFRQGTWLQHRSISTQTATELVITPADGSKERTVILDGEIKKTTAPMHISIIPNGLKVYRPK